MSQKQRYLVTYKSRKPEEPKETTFGLYAKKYNQAINDTRVYIHTKGLHNCKDYGYDLKAEPSYKKADVEISEDGQLSGTLLDQYQEEAYDDTY